MIFKFVTQIVLILMNKFYIGYIHRVDYVEYIDNVYILYTLYNTNIGLVEQWRSMLKLHQFAIYYCASIESYTFCKGMHTICIQTIGYIYGRLNTFIQIVHTAYAFWYDYLLSIIGLIQNSLNSICKAMLQYNQSLGVFRSLYQNLSKAYSQKIK